MVRGFRGGRSTSVAEGEIMKKRDPTSETASVIEVDRQQREDEIIDASTIDLRIRAQHSLLMETDPFRDSL